MVVYEAITQSYAKGSQRNAKSNSANLSDFFAVLCVIAIYN